MVRPAGTLQISRWGLPPYTALAAALNFCNKAEKPVRQFIAGVKK
jgi:hypothetical protein